MNLNLLYEDFSKHSDSCLRTDSDVSSGDIIDEIVFDSRRIVFVENVLFIALKGNFRDGHEYIEDAYKKGIRIFLISKQIDFSKFPLANFFISKDVLLSLQKLASWHRKKTKTKVIAVAGSHGKTTVKEWLYFLLSDKHRVYRSPKSYNSQLGVPLSLLQINQKDDYAIIEVGSSLPGEMLGMKKMINPDYGIITCFSTDYIDNFSDQKEYKQELLFLIKGVESSVANKNANLNREEKQDINLCQTDTQEITRNLVDIRWKDPVSTENLSMAISMAQIIGIEKEEILRKVPAMPNLAMRLETYDGINNSVIINDTYNLDVNALSISLSYQKAISGKRKRIVLLAMDDEFNRKKEEIQKEIKSANPDLYLELKSQEDLNIDFSEAVVLLKGSQQSFIWNIAQKLKKHTHTTKLEINLSAIRDNLSFFRKKINAKTKMLCMVKAQSYGSGLEKIAVFLEQQGVSYLGVACVDEGVELRKCGIKLPILVLNMEQENFKSCIQNNLEPAIYSFNQLDKFIRELIDYKKTAYPIHLKFDTGMHRLGFNVKDANKVMEMIKSQPEIMIKGVFSHLADSGSNDKSFTINQIALFDKVRGIINKSQGYPILFHLLNTDGIVSYNSSQHEMVRLGIGMYGVSSRPIKELKPVFTWSTRVSQIKSISVGDYIGYSKEHHVKKECRIAIIPVGYADGFRRSLKNGQGGVYINNTYCKTVGNICMDMTTVNIGDNNVQEGDLVEIIGKNQSINDLAFSMKTIPYEILTSISKRVHRIYIED